MGSAAARAIFPAIAPIERRLGQREDPSLARYARDPFAMLEDGLVLIPDLVTLEPVVLDPFPHQVELAEAWIDLDHLVKTGRPRFRNVHEEKSRQMGLTWWFAYLFSWLLSYHDVPMFAMSLKSAEIDDGGGASSTDSFFGRIRWMTQVARLTPDAPTIWPAKLADALRFRGGNDPVISNTATGGYLTGSGATPDPGRGGRYACGLIDEAARLPFGEQAHKALARAIPKGRVYNSTPEGQDNLYYRLREQRPKGYEFLRHHWSEHPVYGLGKHTAASAERREDGTIDVLIAGDPDCPMCAGNRALVAYDPSDPQAHRYPGKLTSPWYEEAIVELTDEEVASELDIDYTASLTARVYTEFSEELHVAAVPIPWVESLQQVTELGFDYGLDTTAVLIYQDAPRELRLIGEVEIGDATPEEVCRSIRQELIEIGCPAELATPEWTRRYLCVGDPAGDAREIGTNRPITLDYRREGFNISSQPTTSVAKTILAAKRLFLNRPKRFVVSPRCSKFIDHAKHNKWPTDREGRRKAGETKPLDDRHNHAMRAHAYYVTWKFPPPDVTGTLERATRGPEPPEGHVAYDMQF